MIFAYQNYRDFIEDELKKRKLKNESYSLRAYARSLGLPPSTLSEVLKNKKKLTAPNAEKISRSLKLNKKESKYLSLLCQAETEANNLKLKEIKSEIESLADLEKRKKLNSNEYGSLCRWHFFALVELAALPNFQLTVESGTKALGLDKALISSALDQLLTKGVLSYSKEYGYQKAGVGLFASSEVTDLNLRQFHLEMLEKSKSALCDQSPKDRIVGTETFVFSKEALPAANELVEEFFQKMLALAGKNVESANEVYTVGVQMFKLTQKEKGSV